MAIQQFLIYIIIIGAAYAAYTSNRAVGKVYCTFTRRDRGIMHKWAKAKNGERLEFDGGWYYVRTKCITFEPLKSGFNMAFPTNVKRLFFTWWNENPIDPDTGEPYAETPEMRKNLNKREDIEALNRGTQQAFGKQKVGMFGGGLVPILLIVGIVASLYFIWQMQGSINSLGNAVNVLQEMMLKSGAIK